MWCHFCTVTRLYFMSAFFCVTTTCLVNIYWGIEGLYIWLHRGEVWPYFAAVLLALDIKYFLISSLFFNTYIYKGWFWFFLHHHGFFFVSCDVYFWRVMWPVWEATTLLPHFQILFCVCYFTSQCNMQSIYYHYLIEIHVENLKNNHLKRVNCVVQPQMVYYPCIQISFFCFFHLNSRHLFLYLIPQKKKAWIFYYGLELLCFFLVVVSMVVEMMMVL